MWKDHAASTLRLARPHARSREKLRPHRCGHAAASCTAAALGVPAHPEYAHSLLHWRPVHGGAERGAAVGELLARGVGDLAGAVQHARRELVEEDDAKTRLDERAQRRHRDAVPRADAAEVVTGAAVRAAACAVPRKRLEL